MPATYIINTDNFNRTNRRGWYTRLLFSYADYDLSYIDATSDLFSALNPAHCRGTVTFPPGYWQKAEGRIIRVQGCFLYSGDSTELNIVTRLKDSNGSEAASAQNNGSYHTFGDGGQWYNVPVFFEFELSHGYGDFFDWSGYYQYEYKSHNQGGLNTDNCYIPVHGQGSSNFTSTGTYSSELELQISPNSVQPVYITVEELG